MALVVERATALIERGWTQGCDARDRYGLECDWYSPAAEEWCVVAAVSRAARDLGVDSITETQALRQLSLHIWGAEVDPAERVMAAWNDESGRTREDVLAAMRRTLAHLRREEHT